nr:universal stress protein [Saccharopolyspora phatthalungensis]
MTPSPGCPRSSTSWPSPPPLSQGPKRKRADCSRIQPCRRRSHEHPASRTLALHPVHRSAHHSAPAKFHPSRGGAKTRRTPSAPGGPARRTHPAPEPEQPGPTGPENTGKNNACLLVVGHRGGGGFDGLFLGSVAAGVLHHAQCPVAVVRAAGGAS